MMAVWFLLILRLYHFGPGSEPFPPWELIGHLLDLVLLAFIGVGAWGLGRLALWRLRLDESSPREAPIIHAGAGLGVLSLAVLMLAAAGLLYRPVLVALPAIGTLALTLRRPGPRRTGGATEPWRRSETWLAGSILLAGLATLAASLAPPEFYDALIYHLAVPAHYLRHHAMIPVPGNYYASFPANMGMLYAVGLSLRGGSLAQSIHWLCGALTVLALFVLAHRHTDRMTALLACLFFALIPGVMLVSTYAIADLGVTLFATLCFAALLNHWREGGRRWLIAAGLFAGFALGTKYTAVLVVMLPGLAALLVRRPPVAAAGGRTPGRLAGALMFGVIAFLVLSPWLVRNAVISGNPVAPYLSGSAEAGSPGIGEEIGRRLPAGAGPLEVLAHDLAAPWNITMRRLGAGGYLGPVFLMLLPALPFSRDLPRVVPRAALLAGVGFLAWAFTSQVTRYAFPLLPLIALLAAVAVRRLPRVLTVPALAWSLLYGFYLFCLLVLTVGSWSVVSGAESTDAYLSRRVTYYPAMLYLRQTPASSRVLFAGEGRTFYCPREAVAATPLERQAIERYGGPGDEPALLASLRADGITHLLVSDPELRRTRGVTADGFMRRYFPDGSPRQLYEANGVRVYELPRARP